MSLGQFEGTSGREELFSSLENAIGCTKQTTTLTEITGKDQMDVN